MLGTYSNLTIVILVAFFDVLESDINLGYIYIPSNLYNKGNNKITELRAILQRESQNS